MDGREEYQITDNIKIVLNDCLTEMRTFPDQFADVYVFSPPYNIGLKYNGYSDNLAVDEYLNWIAEIGTEIRRTLKDSGSLFINMGGTNVYPSIAMDVCAVLRKQFVLQNNIVWVKSQVIDGATRGHFKPINSPRFLNHNHESVFHFTKDGHVLIDRLAIGVPYTHKSNIDRWKHGGEKKDMVCGGDVWFIPYKTVQSKAEKFYHPATFPELLVEKCLRLHGELTSETLVVDPFVGIGTTLKVCKDLGLKGIGIEIDKVYYEGTRQRLEKVEYPLLPSILSMESAYTPIES